MKKIISLLLVLSLNIFVFTACTTGQKDNANKIYYVTTEKDSLYPVDYDFAGDNTQSLVQDALDMLMADTKEVDYMSTIPSGVELLGWTLNDGDLSLDFSSEYLSLDTYTEILIRAAIVKTLTQIDGVSTVSIYIDGSPLTDSTGVSVGTMTSDSFIDDFGEETDSLLSTELTLYFVSADGMSIVSETREAYYSRNVALEKLIIEELLEGPESEDLLASIPTGTKLNSVSVSEDGICYVNFDAAFETSITGVTENATIYSIVDSLCELDSIKQVQILVNGETPHLSNLEIDISAPIEKNKDIIRTMDDIDDTALETEDETATTDVIVEIEEEEE